MTLQTIDQAADILIAFIFAVSIGAAIVNWSVAQYHKRKAAKAQAEYWTKKTAQLNTAAEIKTTIEDLAGVNAILADDKGRRYDRS